MLRYLPLLPGSALQGGCPDGTTRILGSFLPLAGVSEQLTEACADPSARGSPAPTSRSPERPENLH